MVRVKCTPGSIVTYWWVTVNGMEVCGPVSWEVANKRRDAELEYNPRNAVQLSSVKVAASLSPWEQL